jgi:hypothetical protein
MRSFIYPSVVSRMLAGEVNFVRDRFGVLLLDNSHTPDEADEDRRDLDGEVSGQGYRPDGQDADVKVLTDAGGKSTIVLGGVVWPSSTISARYAAYYRKSGNEARDALLALIDFGKDVQSVNDLFSLSDSEIDLFTS